MSTQFYRYRFYFYGKPKPIEICCTSLAQAWHMLENEVLPEIKDREYAIDDVYDLHAESLLDGHSETVIRGVPHVWKTNTWIPKKQYNET